MPTTNKPISVAEALEIVPNNDSWINDGVTGVVRDIKASGLSSKRKFWRCTVADTVGSATIGMTVFTPPNFGIGDLIDVTGQGIKRKEYNGEAEIGVGQKTEIHVLGKSAHHQEQVQRSESHKPSVNGQQQPVNGQTVGMALKEAAAMLAVIGYDADDLRNPAWWKRLHEIASDVIRVSRMLERGALAAPVKYRETGVEEHRDPEPEPDPEPTPPPRTSGRADPPPRSNPVPHDRDDEDVPF